MVLLRGGAVLFFITFCLCDDSLDREARGIDSKAFNTLIKVGHLIAEFGVDNLESYITGLIHVISKNVFIFYFLLLAAIFTHLLTFSFTLLAVKSKEKPVTQTYHRFEDPDYHPAETRV